MLRRFVDVEPHEVAATIWSFAYFFLLLCGYYVIRPVREEMGITGGVDDLPWLFTATFVTMLAAVPVYSAVVSRFPKRRVIPVVYRFFALNLVAFYLLFRFGPAAPRLAQVFYVWSAVYNLFVVSVFWSFMADVFDEKQSRRLFGFIAAGGTAGALVGPFLTSLLVAHIGALTLLLVSAALLEASVLAVGRLQPRGSIEKRVGGSTFAGFKAVARSPYLLLICAQTIIYSALSTFLYFQQQRIIAESLTVREDRVALFAQMDLWINLLALGTQSLGTGAFLTHLGVGAGLALSPALSGVGFVALSATPLLGTVVGFAVLRRALHFALEKPARETLFTVVDDEQKYKAKGFIDTVVYRGGDAASGWAFEGLKALGLTVSALALSAVPISLVGVAVAIALGRRKRE